MSLQCRERTYCMEEVVSRVRDVTIVARCADVNGVSGVCCVQVVRENRKERRHLENALRL